MIKAVRSGGVLTTLKISSAEPVMNDAFAILFAFALRMAYCTLSADISTPTTDSNPSLQVTENSPEPQYASTRYLR